jgi:hypothetical protein
MADWRLQGQERYLKAVELCWATYKPYREGWDHDHCEFCGRKFAVQGGDFTEGYTTKDRYHWVCKDCYGDFKSMFDWKIVLCDEDAT